MTQILIVMALGLLLGIVHEREKNRAYNAGFKKAEMQVTAYYKRMESMQARRPVDAAGYAALPNQVPYYLRREQARQAVNAIATQAVTLGRAAGRVQ